MFKNLNALLTLDELLALEKTLGDSRNHVIELARLLMSNYKPQLRHLTLSVLSLRILDPIQAHRAIKATLELNAAVGLALPAIETLAIYSLDIQTQDFSWRTTTLAFNFGVIGFSRNHSPHQGPKLDIRKG